MTDTSPRPVRLLRRPQLRAMGITWTPKHLREQEARGLFPVRVKLGENTAAYVESEINEWIADRMAARRTPGAA